MPPRAKRIKHKPFNRPFPHKMSETVMSKYDVIPEVKLPQQPKETKGEYLARISKKGGRTDESYYI